MQESLFALDIAVTQGDDYSFSLRFKDVDGVAVDIDLWDFFYTAKDEIDAVADDTGAEIIIAPTAVVKTASAAGGGSIVDTATFSLLAADTGAMTVGKYHQDIQTKVSSLISTIARGALVIKDQVTNRTT